jgi:hypothetical protein
MEYTQVTAASLAQAQERIRGPFIELIDLHIVASYRYRLTVPPGRLSVQPEVALV